MSGDGRYTLGDFGSSWEQKLRSVTKDCLGTCGFLAPEVGKGRYHPFPADVYALGMTVLYMAAQGLRGIDFGAEAGEVTKQRDALIGRLKYSDVLKEVLRRMVAGKPEDRWSVEELAGMCDGGEAAEETVQGIYRVTGKEVCFFSFEERRWKEPILMNRAIVYDSGLCCTQIAEDTLFCCGADWGIRSSGECHAGITAYLVHIYSNRSDVQELPQMNKWRWNSGIVHFQGELFVFGGTIHSRMGLE